MKIEPKHGNYVLPASLQFNESFKVFCLNSIFNHDCVFKILKEIEICNLEFKKFDLFFLDRNQKFSYDTFKVVQENQFTKFVNFVKNHWQKNIMQIITKHLDKEDDGWFNYKKINPNNYEMGKLKKLLKFIDLKNQDLMKKHIEKNLRNFVQFIKNLVPKDVRVKSPRDVQTIYDDFVINLYNFDSFENQKKPFFEINIVYEDEKIVLQKKPQNFFNLIMMIFEKTLVELSKINVIEE